MMTEKKLNRFIEEMNRIENSIKFQMTDITNFRIEFQSFKDQVMLELKEIKGMIKNGN